MTAIFETGGKQYRVAEGDVVYIEKLPVEAEETVTFDKVGNTGRKLSIYIPRANSIRNNMTIINQKFLPLNLLCEEAGIESCLGSHHCI